MYTHTHTHNRFTALFLGPPSELVPEEIFFWTFMVQGEITDADTSTIRLVTTLSALISSPPPSSPHFTPDALPAATLPLYPGLRQAPNMLACIPSGMVYSNSNSKVLILHPIPVDRGHITKQIQISDSNNMFSVFLRNESIDHSSFRSVGSLFHARGAATEKALSSICRCVCGMTRSPLYEANSADRAGISASGVSKSKMYYGVCPKSDK